VSKTGGSEKMSLFLHEHGTSAVQCSAFFLYVFQSTFYILVFMCQLVSRIGFL
jgi:hypothetical protein